MKNNPITTKLIAAGALAACSVGTFAHDGHGLAGSHWHATDAWGLLAAMAVGALAVWLGNRK